MHNLVKLIKEVLADLLNFMLYALTSMTFKLALLSILSVTLQFNANVTQIKISKIIIA